MSTEEMRRRVHVATDTIDVPEPDIEALVARAHRSQRTTTRNRLVLAAMVALVAAVATSYAVRNAQEPPLVNEPELVNGDAQALAALVLQELDVDPAARAVGLSDREDQLSVGVVTSGPTDNGGTTSIMADAARVPGAVVDRAQPCASGPTACVSAGGGEVGLTWDPAESPDENAPVLGGTVRLHYLDTTNRVARSLEYHSTEITGDPRTLDLQFSVEELADLVTDTRFGFDTTPELAAVELAGWEISPDGSFSPSARDLTVSGDVEAIVSRHLGPTRVVESSDGHGIDLDLTVDGRAHLVRIHLEPGEAGANCIGVESCTTWQVDGATVGLAWDVGDGIGFDLWLQDADGYHGLVWSGASYPGGDPRQADLPVSVDRLVALLADLDIEQR